MHIGIIVVNISAVALPSYQSLQGWYERHPTMNASRCNILLNGLDRASHNVWHKHIHLPEEKPKTLVHSGKILHKLTELEDTFASEVRC